MAKLLNFDEMITPKIITLVYWLALLSAIVSGLVSMFAGWGGFTFAKFLMGVGIMVGGALGARISCELMIVLFKINENLHKLVSESAHVERAP